MISLNRDNVISIDERRILWKFSLQEHTSMKQGRRK